jgi:hypothetical protein
MIIRCNENKKFFQVKYECPQKLSYYQAKSPNAYIWQLDSPPEVFCNVKYQYNKVCHAFTLLLQEKTWPKILQGPSCKHNFDIIEFVDAFPNS